MKKKLLVLFLLLANSLLFAQEETLLGNGEIFNGGFGGPVIKFTSINNHFGVLVGGQGGWIINHSFIIGGGGYGLANNVKASSSFMGTEELLNFGYGGVEFHYIVNSEKLVHYSVSLLIGAGGIGYREPQNWDLEWDNSLQGFFVMEPTISVMLNITTFFRIGVGGSYRFVSGANLDELKDSKISGLSGEIVLKFGKF